MQVQLIEVTVLTDGGVESHTYSVDPKDEIMDESGQLRWQRLLRANGKPSRLYFGLRHEETFTAGPTG